MISAAAHAAEFDPELQRAFLEAMRLIDTRDYAAAIATLRALLKQSDTPRIRLELARALFLNGQYREARSLFSDVLFDADTPWRVRDNIEAFLREIDAIEGYLRFSASIVHDSNPLNISSQREFTIGGVRLNYIPPENNKPVTGLRYGAQAYQPLSQSARLAFYFTGSYLDYPGITLDRLTIDTGLAKALAEGRASARLGIEAGTFANKRLYDFPYVAGDYALSRSASQQVAAGVKYGYVRFPSFSYLDARYGSFTLTGQKVVPERTLVSGRATLERNQAYEQAYSYNGVALGAGVSYLFSQRPVLLSVNAGLGTRRYLGVDPFFGEQRVDRKTNVELVVRNKEWRWRNFKPAFVIAVEDNRSNIGFFSYRKTNVSIAVE